MEEVQGWWEVPAVALFCDVFRSVFDLFFFEIAELESAILNIQDPDMSISLEQLIIKLLQGFYDDDVNEGNWEEKLHELFDESLENDENPFEKSASFFQLTPRSKVEILFKLCELRIDVEGVMEEIKNIPSEDMQAKYIGKDSQNFNYWYFCDERLYKEDSSTGNNAKLPHKKSTKNASKKRHTNSREKRSKKDKVDQPWTIACYNMSDWEKLMNKLSKSKNSEEKKLVAAMKDHLPLLEEKVAEKDRQLRKRFLELAPKRSSSRISKVQEKKKMEELKAQEEARKAKLEAEKEKAKKEALEMKVKKESRQRRAEERQKAMEERAERAKLRELARSEDYESGNEDNSDDNKDDSDDNKDDSDENNDSDDRDYQPNKNQRGVFPKNQRIRNNYSNQYQQRESYADTSKNKFPSFSYRRISQKAESARFGNGTSTYSRQYSLTFKVQTGYNEPRSSATIQNAENASPMSIVQNTKEESSSKGSGEEMSSDISNPSIIDKKQIIQKNFVNLGSLLSKQDSTTLNANFSNRSLDTNGNNLSPKVTMYKTSVFQNASDVSKWHAAFGSKGQKVQILSSSQDSLASKKIKLEPVKNFSTISPSANSSLSKENVIYKPVQTAFITYGKIIPNRSPAIVKLDYRQPPNPPVSS